MRDINGSFVKLGHIVSDYLIRDKPLTKLEVLQEAVRVITKLEQHMRGMVMENSSKCVIFFVEITCWGTCATVTRLKMTFVTYSA